MIRLTTLVTLVGILGCALVIAAAITAAVTNRRRRQRLVDSRRYRTLDRHR
ncbi:MULTISPECIES: hypothetical protein [unclassified Sphingomonas]|uniref:hypothetical protein n=1 Tax=unclassified Sphingomonas TaxID=196159 RepID=UPI00226A463C|nr:MULTISPECIES: hypothetical protein [unclassified Sphingomonas]